MSSEAQIAANRANAQHSTGPTSPEGRSTSSRNSVSHGLSATPNTLFASDTEAQNNFAQHIQKLRTDCLPEGALEEETFRRYAFATFQINRAQALELQSQDRWTNEPVTKSASPKWNASSSSVPCRNAAPTDRSTNSANSSATVSPPPKSKAKSTLTAKK